MVRTRSKILGLILLTIFSLSGCGLFSADVNSGGGGTTTAATTSVVQSTAQSASAAQTTSAASTAQVEETYTVTVTQSAPPAQTVTVTQTQAVTQPAVTTVVMMVPGNGGQAYQGGSGGSPAQVPSGNAGQAQQPADNSVPYNIPPQPQIGHPSLYAETGVPCKAMVGGVTCSDVNDHTKTYNFQVLPGTVAIVGGFEVDGVNGGVYKAVAGPTTLSTTVTDGFALVTKADWANAEFCFRIGQAMQYGWAHAHESPLPGWNACGNSSTTQTNAANNAVTANAQSQQASAAQAPSAQQQTQQGQAQQGQQANGNRRTTGVGQSAHFNAGEPVIGFRIQLDNGRTYSQCYLQNPPSGGTLTDGVIYPNSKEVAAAAACQ